VGGRSFALHGRMCCGVTSGGLMVRVGREGVTEALDQPHLSRMSLGGRSLAAFVIVAPPGVATDALLAAWVQRGPTVASCETVPAAASRARPGPQPQAPAPNASAAIGSAAERFADLVEHVAHHAGVAVPEPGRGRGLGSSALKVDGSIFAMLTHDQLVVKLPGARRADRRRDRRGIHRRQDRADEGMAHRHQRRALNLARPSGRRSRSSADAERTVHVGEQANLWGSRSRPESVTCGDQHSPATRHDRERVAPPPLSDLESASRLAVAALLDIGFQEHRARRPTSRGRCAPQNQPQAPPGLGRPSRARRADPTTTHDAARSPLVTPGTVLR